MLKRTASWDGGYFEYQQYILWLRSKKIILLVTLFYLEAWLFACGLDIGISIDVNKNSGTKLKYQKFYNSRVKSWLHNDLRERYLQNIKKITDHRPTHITAMKRHRRLTVLSAKSDSDVIFVYKVIRDIGSIDHLCINPIRRIGLIHKLSIYSH